MRFKKTLLAMTVAGAAAAQADYQVEIGASYSANTREWEYDYDESDLDEDTDALALDASVYFKPVSTASGPLAETSFLSKASSVDIFYAKSETEYDFENDYSYGSDESETDTMRLGGHFVLSGPHLILAAMLGQGEDDEVDFDYYSLGFGGYINDRITLMVEYAERELDADGVDEDSVDRIQVTYRQLIQLGGEHCLSFAPFLARVEYYGEESGELGIDVAWYLTRSLGLVAGVVGGAGDNEDGEYSGASSYVGVDYFANENFRISGKLLSDVGEFDSDYEYGDREFNGAGLKFDAGVRF